MSPSRSGRVAVVTGAAQGIGKAIAAGLAHHGDQVVIWDSAFNSAVATAAELSAASGADVSAIFADVTDATSINAAADETTRRIGPVGVLVNNAGIDQIQPFLQSDEETWQRIVAVNLMGTIRCCHVVAQSMVERAYGRIVNIGSDAGRVGSSGEAVYSATKGGVIAFTKTLARELAATGITVNCVCPGPTDTALLGELARASPKLGEALVRAIPMRRVASPAEIAPAVVFLASEGAGYITGQALSVNGGLTMC